MVALQTEMLTKSVGDRLLFGDVTFGLEEGDKVGIVAKNGTGKSTLLRIIAGEEEPDSGTVTLRKGLRMALLEQTPKLDPRMTALQAALSDPPQAPADEAELWDREERAKRLLTQLGIADLDQPVGQMSGGQSKRVALCRALLDNPDALLLDEPTNHLDVAAIEWLEAYLSRQRMTLLMVTHDRYFLDRVCSRIIEIDRAQAYSYEGNYDQYLRRRRERIEAMAAQADKARNLLRREQQWMSRQPQARAGKAKARIDAFYDLKARASVDLRERNVDLGSNRSYIGNKIFEAVRVSKRYGDKVILDDFSYVFSRYEKLGIVGDNGVGKTTFIRMLQGLVEPDSGRWDVGETVRFGYYSQEGIRFDPSMRVVDAVTRIAEEIETAEGVKLSPLQFLQKFLFAPADQQKRVHTLSGGERARLHLAVTLMLQPNFLILDEPTNDLDILTLGILEEYLQDFPGCLIVVSHDRYFLDNVVDHLFVFEGSGTVKDFPGTYSEYKAMRDARRQAAAEASSAPQKSAERSGQAERQRKITFKERLELQQLGEQIASLEEEKKSLEAIFSGEAEGNLDAASKRYTQLKDELDLKELRWLELSELPQ